MYKTRLQAWGLGKKNKEHETLDLVRTAFSQDDPEHYNTTIRGKRVSLVDARKYYNRKGVKDVTKLLKTDEIGKSEEKRVLEGSHNEPTPDDCVKSGPCIPSSGYGLLMGVHAVARNTNCLGISNLVSAHISCLARNMKYPALAPFAPLQTTPTVASPDCEKFLTPGSTRLLHAVDAQAQIYYHDVFRDRDFAGNNAHVSRFVFRTHVVPGPFCHVVEYIRAKLSDVTAPFSAGLDIQILREIEQLLEKADVGFLVYIFQLIVGYSGPNCTPPLLVLLRHIAHHGEMLFGRKENPLCAIISCLINASPLDTRNVALLMMGRLLSLFRDRRGYLCGETVSLMQVYAATLLDTRLYPEALLT